MMMREYNAFSLNFVPICFGPYNLSSDQQSEHNVCRVGLGNIYKLTMPVNIDMHATHAHPCGTENNRWTPTRNGEKTSMTTILNDTGPIKAKCPSRFCKPEKCS
jgi:hypothetical protein